MPPDAPRKLPAPEVPAREGAIHRPSYSGRTAALLLVLCLVFAAAIALPLLKWMPLWLRMETVLAVWWLGWLTALTVLLYRGALVDDDVSFKPPRNWFRWGKGDGVGSGVAEGVSGVGDGCLTFGEGCGQVVVVVIALVLAVGAFWLLIELVLPLLLVAAFTPLRALLARVAHDDHGCEGKFGRALQYGAFWATVYVAPLAGAVWLGHVLRAARG